jgi:hypothetical protein
VKINSCMDRLALGLCVAICAGCASTQGAPGQTVTPVLDSKFGDAVRGAFASQVIDPNAASKSPTAHSLDSRTAKNVIEGYQSGGQGSSANASGASR